ncbi:branched-chain amino acid aminotransferase [Sulfurimonas lithotrophica]|uniref:Branched-chain amino acid aminotransferase n=1 Tax=Sulfurimonas lithotrophica TaxID=2590022 RepID=A0A5P8NZ53_9BACT|nr:aminotransferase class IV family protein [Sulfurimonas lithotrophica]QFR48733.1 branched-chain amino acid aminotransferase [Sulfurimonas lithotrophica]
MKNEFLETIKILDAKVWHPEYHQKRYESVLKHFGVCTYKKLEDFIKPPKKGLYRCRLVYTPEDIKKISVEYIEYEKKDINTLKLVYDDEIDYPLKSTDRSELNKLYEKRQDADDILIVKKGYLTDTSIANIALFDGEWKTPKYPLLKGTTRQRLLDSGKIHEDDIKVQDIGRFSKVALLNAMIDFDIIADENIKDVFC